MIGIFNDSGLDKLSSLVLYLFTISLIIQNFHTVYAIAAVLMSLAAILLVIRALLLFFNKMGLQPRNDHSKMIYLRFPGYMFLCACVMYSQGRMSAGHLFLGLAAVALVPAILLKINGR